MKTVIEWELFRDDFYYDMWAVRPVGDRDFHSPRLFHLSMKADAENLKSLLSQSKCAEPIEHNKGSEAVELIYSEMRNEFKKLLNQKGFDTPTWFKGYEAALWDLKIIIQDTFNVRLDEIKIKDLKPKTNEQ